MRPVVVSAVAGAGGTATSPAVVLDQYLTPENCGIAAVVTSGSPTFNLEISQDDPFATYATDYNTNGNWTLLSTSGSSNLTASTWSNLAYPVRAIRVRITAGANSSVQLTINQAGAR